MQNYSSAKLQLLALKWAEMEKLRDYLLHSRFTIYKDNKPLAYIKESKLGAVQIQWLNELFLTSILSTDQSSQIKQLTF